MKAAEAARANGSPWTRSFKSSSTPTRPHRGQVSALRIWQVDSEFARNPVQAAKSAVTGMLEKLGPLGVAFGAVATAAAAAGVACSSSFRRFG